MQEDGELRGAVTIPPPPPPRGRLNGLLAIVAIVALVVISAVTARVWAGQLATRSGVGAENAAPNAGAGSAVVHDDACNMLSNAGSAIVHDDAWNRPRSDEVHPWVNLRDDEGNVHRVRVPSLLALGLRPSPSYGASVDNNLV